MLLVIILSNHVALLYNCHKTYTKPITSACSSIVFTLFPLLTLKTCIIRISQLWFVYYLHYPPHQVVMISKSLKFKYHLFKNIVLLKTPSFWKGISEYIQHPRAIQNDMSHTLLHSHLSYAIVQRFSCILSNHPYDSTLVHIPLSHSVCEMWQINQYLH